MHPPGVSLRDILQATKCLSVSFSVFQCLSSLTYFHWHFTYSEAALDGGNQQDQELEALL